MIWTDRHKRVLHFALRRFVRSAYMAAEDAFQIGTDKQTQNGNAFLRDARTADEVISMIDEFLPPTNPHENTFGEGI